MGDAGRGTWCHTGSMIAVPARTYFSIVVMPRRTGSLVCQIIGNAGVVLHSETGVFPVPSR